LHKNGRIVNNKDFENGIVKIQGGLEHTLTPAEKHAVKNLKKPIIGGGVGANTGVAHLGPNVGVADRAFHETRVILLKGNVLTDLYIVQPYTFLALQIFASVFSATQSSLCRILGVTWIQIRSLCFSS